jgi:acyl dehydratase
MAGVLGEAVGAPLAYESLKSFPPLEHTGSYDKRDVILYALGVGAASQNPLDERELQLVYEARLKCLPTMAVVAGWTGVWCKEPQYSVDWKRVLHGEQRLSLDRPLPVEATVRSVLTVDEIYDKGARKNAILCTTRKLFDANTAALLATLQQSWILRGNGGFGGPSNGPPKPHPVPGDRAPDAVVELPTRIDQALLYRLSGDYNPLHVDARIAAAGGFDRPILHGLCTYGIVARALARALFASDPDSICRLDVRFTGPVFPGETLRTEIWRETGGKASFRAWAIERNIVVIDNGCVESR